MLELHDVSVAFGGVRALDRVSLHVGAGARHALVGANGAGKTTVLNVIAGAVTPGGGRILLEGRDITRLPAHRRAQLGIARTFQTPSLFGRQSVADNVALALWRRERGRLLASQAWRRHIADAVDALLDQVGLTGKAHVPAASLPHGEQSLLDLAVALAGKPRLLLLDEPAAGLAPEDRCRLAELVETLPEAVAVLIVDHDSDLIDQLATAVTTLDHGRAATTLVRKKAA